MHAEIRLTKDAHNLFARLYKSYLIKREAGCSKSLARRFGDSQEIASSLSLDLAIADIDDLIRELSRSGLVNAAFYDDTVFDCALTDHAIIIMENRFVDGLKGVLSFLSQFA